MKAAARTVVIIDDDREFAASLRAVLTAEGYEVHTAQSGAEGVALAERVQPSLIVLDVMMGHTTEGFEVSRMLRTHRTLGGVPILLVTGICRELNLPFSFETDDTFLPVTRVVEKPVDPKTLLRLVDSILSGTKQPGRKVKENSMGTTKKALIVDDNPEFAASVADLLKGDGYRVVTAGDGVKGWEAAQKEKPDVVLLDVMMEDCSAGLDLVRKLRDGADTKGVPVFIVTGIRKPETLLESYAPGEAFPNVKNVFEKPMEPAKLMAALQSVA